jgi:hypothetical protein
MKEKNLPTYQIYRRSKIWTRKRRIQIREK